MIEPYDPLWPQAFAVEAVRIEQACTDEELPVRIEHIGSTSVPGMSAKPIIDILAGCPPRASRAPYVAVFRQLGYEHKGAFGIPGRNYFRRGTPRSHHLHLVSWSSAFWHDHLLFRDYLRAHDDLAREYAALKRELAAGVRAGRDHAWYNDNKGPFIRSVLRLARGERDAAEEGLLTGGELMITGVHALIYSNDAEATRTFFRDVLKLESVDAGRGWLIFALPPAELGIHPADGETGPELYLMCDDVERTVAEMKAAGVETTRPIADQGWGRVTALRVPGGIEVGLYEPRHPTALHLSGGQSGHSRESVS